MDKIWLIIKREYTSRVLKKSFLLTTLLTPLGIGLIMVIAGYFGSSQSNSKKKILVKDETGIIKASDFIESEYIYQMDNGNLDTLKKQYADRGFNMLIHIPPYKSDTLVSHQINYISKDKLSIIQLENLEEKFENIFKEYKLNNSPIDKSILAKLEIKIKLENALINEKNSDIVGDKSSKFSSVVATVLSYLMGFMMYIVILVFGGMVMRSVMEEKINRVVEVMISSVKPFQLMLGKIIGVGLVGLTQLGIWMILIPVVGMIISGIMGVDTSSSVMGNANIGQAAEAMKGIQEQPDMISKVMTEIRAFNWGFIIPVFIIYFLGGFFIYSSLFAAVGSAVSDDLNESQQLMVPLMIPVIIAFVMLPSVFNDPDGKVALFGSLFPLFSPIIMPARLTFDPPMWQVVLSILFLIIGVISFAWVAGRIYRVGIFMYGKKTTFKELGKWIFYKD